MANNLIVTEPNTQHKPGPGIEVCDLSLCFDDNLIFDQLSIRVPGGVTTCILGPSGIGKSSLLRAIAGLLQPSNSCNILTDDGLSLAGRIAYMDQSGLLMPWLKVIDNVVLGNRLRGEKPNYQKAHDILAAVGLADVSENLPESLSGGMRQRTALARTFCRSAR